MTDGLSLLRIINSIKPDEIYNLAAQSHVAVSFEEPEYTANSDALGTLRLLEIIRNSNFKKKLNFIKLELLSYMEKQLNLPKMKILLFTLEAPMVLQNYMHIG